MAKRRKMNDGMLDHMPASWDSQFQFYEAQAKRHRLAYVGITLTSGLIGLAIPIVIGYLDVPDIVPALLGTAIALLALVDSVYQTRDTWIRSRDAAEALRSEGLLYRARAGAYSKHKNPEAYLGARVATISESEVRAWRQKAVEDAAL